MGIKVTIELVWGPLDGLTLDVPIEDGGGLPLFLVSRTEDASGRTTGSFSYAFSKAKEVLKVEDFSAPIPCYRFAFYGTPAQRQN